MQYKDLLQKRITNQINNTIMNKVIEKCQTSKIHSNGAFPDRSILNSVRKLILFSFELDIPPAFRKKCEVETKHS